MRRGGRIYCTYLLLGIVLSLAGGMARSFAATTQFYSWVTTSGEMVLTDDPGQIPPQNVRGPVSVHHFQEVARSSAARSPVAADSHRSNPVAGDTAGTRWSFTEAEMSEMMDLLTEPAEQGLASYADGMPPAPPAYLGLGPLYGISTKLAVSNPSIIRRQYLSQLRKAAISSPSWRWEQPSVPRVGQATLQQSLRERESLLDNLLALKHSPTVRTVARATNPSSHCCTLNHHSASGQRSASRR